MQGSPEVGEKTQDQNSSVLTNSQPVPNTLSISLHCLSPPRSSMFYNRSNFAMTAKAYVPRLGVLGPLHVYFLCKIKKEHRCDFPVTTSSTQLGSHMQEGITIRPVFIFKNLNLYFTDTGNEVCINPRKNSLLSPVGALSHSPPA